MMNGMDIPQTWTGRSSLSEDDPELQDLIRQEKRRQKLGLELIASEVMEPMNHKMECNSDKVSIICAEFL